MSAGKDYDEALDVESNLGYDLDMKHRDLGENVLVDACVPGDRWREIDSFLAQRRSWIPEYESPLNLKEVSDVKETAQAP